MTRLHKILLSVGIVAALCFARAPWTSADSIPPTTYLNGAGVKIGSGFRLQFPLGWTGSVASGLITLVAPGGTGGSVTGGAGITATVNDGGVATVALNSTLPTGELIPDPRYRLVKIVTDYTATAGDFIEATCGVPDAGGTACTITLPSAAVVGSTTTLARVTIKDIGCHAATGPLVIRTAQMDLSTQSIDGATTKTISTDCGGVVLIPDGYNWYTEHGGLVRRVQSGATILPAENMVQFDGTGIAAADDPTNFRTVVTAPGLVSSITTQAANLFLAGPATGAAAAPTFRALVSADLPAQTVLNTSLAKQVWVSYADIALGLGASISATNETVGMEFALLRSRVVTGCRFYWPGGKGALTERCELWTIAGALLATGDVSVNAAGIYSGTFTVPYTITSSNILANYLVSTWETSG